MSTSASTFDVAVIGAGIVGSAIARVLTGYQLSVALVEANPDVGGGASKANTAILHTGFDAPPGSLEARLVREGSQLLRSYAAEAGIPIEETGAVLVAWTEEQLELLPGLKAKAELNGYRSAYLVGADDVYGMVPTLNEGVRGGLVVPDEAITCTWTTNLALATDAVNRGAHLFLSYPVDRVEQEPGITHLRAADGRTVSTRWVVNAAGLGADLIDAQFGYDRFTLTPRRGELIVYDKQARSLVNKIVLPVPTARGKGVLISPTIYGNVVLGPTAEDLTDRSDASTSEAGFEFLLDKGQQLMPSLLAEEVTASYAGLRAASSHSDYLIAADHENRYLVVGGIRSTGLSSGMAVAEYVAETLASCGGLTMVNRCDLPPAPRMPNIGEAFLRPYADAQRIAEDDAYGRIVCFCERVTAGEIRDTFRSPIPPPTLDGLRRRTRAQMGRCQGFYCSAEISRMFAADGAPVECRHTPSKDS